MKRIPIILAGLSILVLGGCANLSATQQQNLQLELSVAEQIGADSVQIWCASSGIIYVIADDISSESRVTAFLAGNAQAAIDACPMIASATNMNIRVVTPANLPALTPSSTPAVAPASSAVPFLTPANSAGH